MRKVIIESPHQAHPHGLWPAFVQRWLNVRYARRCVKDSLKRNEAPIASHLLYTQPGILKDSEIGERQLGIDAGLAWRTVADATVVYVDRGISRGMKYGIDAAVAAGKPIEYRALEGEGAMVRIQQVA